MAKHKDEEKIWYLPNLEGLEAHGPFSTLYILEKFESGELTLDSFIWSPEVDALKWLRLFEIENFQKVMLPYPKCPLPKLRSKGRSQITKVNFSHEGEGEYGEENEYRRYPRAPLESKVLLHNQNIYTEANSIDISEKGIFINLANHEMFKRGEELNITIYNHPDLGTMSVQSVLINKVINDKLNGVGLYFMRLNPKLRQKIAEYVVDQLSDKEKSA